MKRLKVLSLLKTNLEQIQQGNNYALIDLKMLNEKYSDTDDEEILLSLELNNSISFKSYYSQYDNAIKNSLRILDRFSGSPHHYFLAFHCWVVGHCYAHTGNFDKAREYTRKSLKMIDEHKLPNYSLKCDGLHSLAMINHFTNGTPEQTLEHLQAATDALAGPPDFIPDKVRRAGYLTGRGNVFIDTMRVSEALDSYSKALVIYEEVLDLQNMASAYSNIATCFIETRELDKAEEFLHKSVELRLKAGSPYALSISYHNLGLVYKAKEQWDLAEEYAHRSKKILMETNCNVEMGDTDNLLAEIAECRKNAQQAMA